VGLSIELIDLPLELLPQGVRIVMEPLREEVQIEDVG
jgi:hypothetical protein